VGAQVAGRVLSHVNLHALAWVAFEVDDAANDRVRGFRNGGRPGRMVSGSGSGMFLAADGKQHKRKL
jgi:hypothetical protein